MNQNSSSLGFLSAIAGAIVSFCKTFIRSMGVVEDAVSMAEASVRVARKKQVIDLEIDMTNYAVKAVNKAALELAKQEEAMQEYAGSNEARRELLSKSKQHLSEKIHKRLAELEQVAE